jgi:uncharacterized protein (TIGR03435 family)
MIPGLIDHLWQSTIFAGAAWLLTLALRKNRAQVRYWVLFVASVKFLVPFSLLVGLGSLAPRRTAAPVMPIEWVAAAEQVGEPLMTLPAVAVRIPADQPSNYWVPAALTVWGGGLAAIAGCWLLRWFRVLKLRRSAARMSIAGVAVPVLSATGLVEPGVFGIFRPVLLLPEGILETLSAGQLEAILAHELCHVRRRDNLTAAIHMLVQATFWFHPLVWWLGVRLTDERERACDEEVLRLGSAPRVYAEGILHVCKLYVESPVACVSGVTGSDLKKRIEAIMKNRSALRLSFVKKVALSVAGMAALAAPIVVGILHTPVMRAQSPAPVVERTAPVPRLIAQQTAPAPATPSAPRAQAPAVVDWQTAAGGKMAFEVATVKRGEFVPPSFPIDGSQAFTSTGGRFIANFPLVNFIMFAYKFYPAPDVRDAMVAHLPSWVSDNSYRFTIEGKAGASTTKDQFRLMMQSLLAERFHVAVHFENQQGPLLALTLVKPGRLGPKLLPHALGQPCGPAPAPDTGAPSPTDLWPQLCGAFSMRPAPDRRHMQIGSRDSTLALLASNLSTGGSLWTKLTAPVVDQTGVTGSFDFTIEFSPPPGGPLPLPRDVEIDPEGPVFMDALREQLGLKLESTKGPTQVIVIDHVEAPSEN